MSDRDKLREALIKARDALSYVERHAPGYDWNADPLRLTLRTGEAYAAIQEALED